MNRIHPKPTLVLIRLKKAAERSHSSVSRPHGDVGLPNIAPTWAIGYSVLGRTRARVDLPTTRRSTNACTSYRHAEFNTSMYKARSPWAVLGQQDSASVKSVIACADLLLELRCVDRDTTDNDIIHCYCSIQSATARFPFPSPMTPTLLVEIELVCLGRTLDLTSICVLQIALDDVVPVLPHSPQTRFLHYGRDDCSR